MARAQTTKQYIAKLNKRIKELTSDKFLKTCILEIHSLQVKRIFTGGKKANGAAIGRYSTKDMLIGKSSFIKKSAASKILGSKGKRKKLSWVTLNKRKLAVLKGGYKELRRLQGRKTGKVDLHYTGLFELDYSNSLTRKKKGVWVVGLKRGFNSKKFEGMIDRYGKKVFTLSKSERKRLNFCITKKRLKLGV